MPPRIWLFREPLFAEWHETGVRMDDLVRHVVVHEAGHHFGFSDDDMHWLEEAPGPPTRRRSAQPWESKKSPLPVREKRAFEEWRARKDSNLRPPDS